MKWLVVDMLPITMMDATGLYTARDVVEALEARGIVTVFAGRQTEWAQWSQRHSPAGISSRARFFPTLRQALRAFDAENLAAG